MERKREMGELEHENRLVVAGHPAWKVPKKEVNRTNSL
jgi:hypothetical protein